MSPTVFAEGRAAALVIAASLLAVGSAGAQTLVTGVVVDAPSRRPIEGVSVVLAGTLYGTVTGADGAFALGPVPDGAYTMRLVRAGYEPVEMHVNVPVGRFVVVLGEERPELPGDALEAVVRGFEIGSFRGRGDPLVGDDSAGLRRVPGVTSLRYAAGLSGPIVRGLADGRTARQDDGVPASMLEVPGVGRLDLSVDPAFQGGMVYFGPGTVEMPAAAAAVRSSLDRPAAAFRPVAILETGYETNVKAFEARGRLQGLAGSSRYRLRAIHQTASGYDAGGDAEVGAGYHRSAVGLVLDRRVSGESSLRLSGQFADYRSVEVPGAAMMLDSGSLLGGSLRFETSPEGSLVRRLTGRVAVARSDIDLSASSAGIGTGDAFRRVVSAVLAADLHQPFVDQLQVGVDGRLERLDGSISAGDSLVAGPRRFWPRVDVTSANAFVSASGSSLYTVVSLNARIGLASFKSGGVVRDPAVPGPAEKSYLSGGISGAVLHRFGPALRLRLRAAALRRPPSALHRYSDALPPVDGPRRFDVRGNPDLKPETIYAADAGVQVARGSLTFRVQPFIVLIQDYIAARPTVAAESWIFRNGAARFWGFELVASYAPLPFFTAAAHLDLTDARDLRMHESTVNAPPVSGRIDVTAASPGERILLEVSSEFAFRTDRVASTVGEMPADGYLLIHWWLGLPLSDRLSVRLGIFNLFNSDFRPHPGLHYLDGDRIPGPGRSWLFAVRAIFN